MSSIEQTIRDQLKEAMRAKDQVLADTLRAMKSALKYKMVEKNQQPLTEAEIFSVFQTLVKQRREAMEQYQKAGALEQADKEKRELEIISSFLPQPLTQAELEQMVAQTIKELGAKEPKDMGRVMKELSPKTVGRADGKTLSEIVRKQLSGS